MKKKKEENSRFRGDYFVCRETARGKDSGKTSKNGVLAGLTYSTTIGGYSVNRILKKKQKNDHRKTERSSPADWQS